MPLLFVYKTLLNPKIREQALGEKVEGKRAKAKGEHKEIEERSGHLRCPVIEKQKLNNVSSAGVA